MFLREKCEMEAVLPYILISSAKHCVTRFKKGAQLSETNKPMKFGDAKYSRLSALGTLLIRSVMDFNACAIGVAWESSA